MSVSMKPNRLLWAALVPVALLSCSKPPASSEPAAAPKREAVAAARPAVSTTRLQGPVTVQWQKLDLSATSVRLYARIARTVALPSTVSVSVEVPPGANMTVGRTSFELAPNAAPTELLEPIELHYGQLPVQDLVIHVKGGDATGGFAFDVPYRFGRPAPADEHNPAATGEHVMHNGRDLGAAVPLDGKAAQ